VSAVRASTFPLWVRLVSVIDAGECRFQAPVCELARLCQCAGAHWCAALGAKFQVLLAGGASAAVCVVVHVASVRLVVRVKHCGGAECAGPSAGALRLRLLRGALNLFLALGWFVGPYRCVAFPPFSGVLTVAMVIIFLPVPVLLGVLAVSPFVVHGVGGRCVSGVVARGWVHGHIRVVLAARAGLSPCLLHAELGAGTVAFSRVRSGSLVAMGGISETVVVVAPSGGAAFSRPRSPSLVVSIVGWGFA
jgi:hypothetical protein